MALEHYPVLQPDQQYHGIATNVYLRAGRALIRVIIMMADDPVNQTRVVGAAPTLTGIKHTKTDPEAIEYIGPRKGKIAG